MNILEDPRKAGTLAWIMLYCFETEVTLIFFRCDADRFMILQFIFVAIKYIGTMTHTVI